MLTLGEIVRRNARPETFGRKVALIHGDRRLTYAEVNERANRIGHALLGLGVARGDRVAVLGRNAAEFVAIIVALAKIGAVMVPLNVGYSGDEIVYATRQSGCRVVVVEASFGTCPTRPPRPSVTDGSTRATSGGSTRTGSSTSWAGPRT